MAAGEAIAMQVEAQPLAAPANWCSTLAQAGAVIEGGAVMNFGDEFGESALAQTGTVIADLSHFGLIAVEGPEAQKFLGSLFTGDVKLVSPTMGQFTSWCDGKGRMQATFWLFMRGEAYYLLLPQDLLGVTQARLKQFLLRTKATVAEASANLVRVGLSGAALATRLAPVLGATLPEARGETVELNGITLVAIPGADQVRWLALGTEEGMSALWEAAATSARPVGKAAWDLLDIMAGVPLLQPATSGEFIPQMLDLEALGGLSFKKGCYPGQEVVARLQYRGQLKRRLYKACIASGTLPAPGARLYGTSTSESVGMVLAAARDSSGGILLLAVVVIEQKTSGDIHLGSPQGPRVEFTERDVP